MDTQCHWDPLYNTSVLPATGGPTIIGRENIPRIKPMACDAPTGPTMSKAMGPMRQTNTPSQIPITRVMAIRPPKLAENGMHIVVIPRTASATCCIRILLTQAKSATFPNTIRPKPDVILIHMISKLPSDSGNISFVCLIWKNMKTVSRRSILYIEINRRIYIYIYTHTHTHIYISQYQK